MILLPKQLFVISYLSLGFRYRIPFAVLSTDQPLWKQTVLSGKMDLHLI